MCSGFKGQPLKKSLPLGVCNCLGRTVAEKGGPSKGPTVMIIGIALANRDFLNNCDSKLHKNERFVSIIKVKSKMMRHLYVHWQLNLVINFLSVILLATQE